MSPAGDSVEALESHLMNRRLSVCLVALLGSGCFLQGVSAQTPGMPGAPGAAPAATVPSVVIPQFKLDRSAAPDEKTLQTMQQVVGQLIEILKTASPADQSKARDTLVAEMQSPNAGNVNTAYIDSYARVLDDALVTALKAKPDIRTRLLLGIVAARAAERAGPASGPLSDTAELLLQDAHESVVLWGMKTTRQVLPPRLGLGQNAYKSLLDRIVPIANKYPGPVTEEAYLALTLEPLNLGNPRALQDPVNVAKVKVVVPYVHQLFAKRVSDWSAGVPKTPGAEKAATLFLSTGGVWANLTPDQRKSTIAMTHEMLTRAMAAWSAGVPKTPEREELTDLIRKSSSALSVIAGYLREETLQGAAKDLSQLTEGTTIPMAQGWMTSVTNAVNAMPLMQRPPASASGATTQSSARAIGQAGLAK